jgi:F-type H+-transporting ATPase subunit a
MEHPFVWYDRLPSALRLLPQHTFTAILIMVLLVVLAYLARSALFKSRDPVVPDQGFSLRNIFELLVENLVQLSDGMIGKKGRKYVSLFGSFFVFILTANLFGLLPGFSPPTSNINTTLGLALVSFCAYHYFGLREHGPNYIKQFIGPMTSVPSGPKKILTLLFVPVLIISILFFSVLESISHLVRPVSLSLRLFGNMFGDHLVLEIFTELTRIVFPVLFYVFGALVSLIQAFVFTLLSMIYVAMAVSHQH